MGMHDRFGMTGAARGVDQERFVFWLRDRQWYCLRRCFARRTEAIHVGRNHPDGPPHLGHHLRN